MHDVGQVESRANAIRHLLAKNHKKEDWRIIVPVELLRQAERTKQISIVEAANARTRAANAAAQSSASTSASSGGYSSGYSGGSSSGYSAPAPAATYVPAAPVASSGSS